MDVVLWILQILLGLAFVFAGWGHGFRGDTTKDRPGMEWLGTLSPSLRLFIGICEILGGIGLVLPALTNILPWLTPLAAVGLAVMMILASIFHFRRGENRNIIFNLVLFVLAAFIAYGRFVLVPF